MGAIPDVCRSAWRPALWPCPYPLLWGAVGDSESDLVFSRQNGLVLDTREHSLAESRISVSQGRCQYRAGNLVGGEELPLRDSVRTC